MLSLVAQRLVFSGFGFFVDRQVGEEPLTGSDLAIYKIDFKMVYSVIRGDVMLKKIYVLGLLVNAVFSVPLLFAQNNNEHLGNNDAPMVEQHLSIFYDKLQKSDLWSRAQEDIEIRLARHQPLDTRNEAAQKFNHDNCEYAAYPSDVLKLMEEERLPAVAALTTAIYEDISQEKLIKLAPIGASMAFTSYFDSMHRMTRLGRAKRKGNGAYEKELENQKKEAEQKSLEYARYQESLNIKMDLSIRQVTDEEFNEVLFFKVKSVACYLPLPLQSLSTEEREKFIQIENERSLRILEAIAKSR